MKPAVNTTQRPLAEPAIACAAALLLFVLVEGGIRWVFAAIAAAAGAILLSRMTADFVSGIVLRRERAFAPGDALSTGTASGHVVRIGWLTTTLAGSGNEHRVRVRNSVLAETRVAQCADGIFRRKVSGVVVVRRATDPEVVRRVLLDIALGQTGVLSAPPPEVLFEKIDADTLRFRFAAWTSNRQDGGTQLESDLATTVGDRFAALGIDAVVRFASDASRPDLG